MQYRKDRKGNDISLLGFGCMRFEGSGTGEYFQKANDQVMEAIRQGINYFDTAYVYKNNEKVLGRILTENKSSFRSIWCVPLHRQKKFLIRNWNFCRQTMLIII